MSPPGPSFTDKQGQYLAFIDAYTRVHGRAPAEADMQRHFGVTPPSVHQMVLTLERAGLIRRQPGWRAASRCWSTPTACPACATPNRHNQCAKELVGRLPWEVV
jgi:DNA-binding FadR family transcriptional regulator